MNARVPSTPRLTLILAYYLATPLTPTRLDILGTESHSTIFASILTFVTTSSVHSPGAFMEGDTIRFRIVALGMRGVQYWLEEEQGKNPMSMGLSKVCHAQGDEQEILGTISAQVWFWFQNAENLASCLAVLRKWGIEDAILDVIVNRMSAV